MDLFLKELLNDVDVLLESKITVEFEGSLQTTDVKLSEALDDNYVTDVLEYKPLSNSDKIDLISKAVNFLIVRDLIKYNSLPMIQRVKLKVTEIEDSFKFLEVSLKAYFSEDDSYVPIEISLARLNELKIELKGN